MKRKKIIVLLLVLSIVFGACSSKTDKNTDVAEKDKNTGTDGELVLTADTNAPADPFGKYEEPVTFTIGLQVDPSEEWPEGDSPTDNQYTRYVKDQLNVDIKVLWTASAADFEQKVNLAISSDTLPDGLIVNDTQFNQMIKSQQLTDLKDSYNNYASDTMKDMIDSSKGLAIDNVTFDGKMYGLTSVSDGDLELTWIRKDWLDKLGLQPPKTVEDLKKIAKEFVEKDPGGNGAGNTIGMTGPQNGGALYATFLTSGTNNYGFDTVFSAYGAYPGWWIKTADGNPVYGSTTQETREALQELADWYKEGLIDPEMGIRQDAAEPIVSGKSGIFSGGWWMGYAALPDVIANNSEANFQAYATPVNNGSGIYTPHASSASYTYAVASRNCEHPEIVIKLNNLLIRDQSQFDTSKGGIGNFPMRIPFGMVDEGSHTVQAMREVLAGNKTVDDYSNDFDRYTLLKNDLEKISLVKKEPVDSMDINTWDVQADPSAWARSYSILVGWGTLTDTNYSPVYSLTYSQTSTIEQRWTNLKKMEDEVFMKIIMNQAPIETFDQFVKDWKLQGGDTITAEVSDYVNSKN